MERPGERLKRVRERLKLTYRDVEQASHDIAERLRNPEFCIALSRLADIENKGTAPSIYRLYALCAIYRLELGAVLSWYGAPLDRLPTESLLTVHDQTHLIHFEPGGTARVPELGGEVDADRTAFLSPLISGWGAMPLRFLNGVETRRYRYGLIGASDWSMYPVLRPGSLVVIEPCSRISSGGWSNELDRPIYFLELRDGYACGWCDLAGDRLILLAHPGSEQRPAVYRYPAEIELIGQVIGAAMLLQPATKPLRVSAVQAPSPDL